MQSKRQMPYQCWGLSVEVVSKPLLGPNLGWGEALNPQNTLCMDVYPAGF
jgi:hypothetical protein